MPLPLKTHTKKPWYVTWACDMEVTNSNYHYRAGSCRGWAGRASHQRLLNVLPLILLYLTPNAPISLVRQLHLFQLSASPSTLNVCSVNVLPEFLSTSPPINRTNCIGTYHHLALDSACFVSLQLLLSYVHQSGVVWSVQHACGCVLLLSILSCG